MDTNVGSPPMVKPTPAASSRASISSPSATTASQADAVYGSVTRGSSWTRVTVLEKSSVDSHISVAPVMAADVDGCGVADNGM
ncbi:Uncharacterised protein [Mycobacteroides abscessus]|nr:Uncharacterised protein [Mycobacteroides abscessus]